MTNKLTLVFHKNIFFCTPTPKRDGKSKKKMCTSLGNFFLLFFKLSMSFLAQSVLNQNFISKSEHDSRMAYVSLYV